MSDSKGLRVSIKMRRTQSRKMRVRRLAIQHRLSVILVSCVIVILAGVLSVASISLRAKWKNQDAQITELCKQLDAEKTRTEEIDELEQYVGTDAYIEDVARETGLAYPNEILLKPEL